MDNNIIMLAEDSHRYVGEYVVTDGESSHVIAHSNEPEKAYKAALDMGANDPILMYIPNNDDTHFIY